MNVFSTTECQIVWLIGATERLASLGLLEETPMKLSNEKAIDLFLEIDKSRHVLFKDDFEMARIFTEIVRDTSDENDIDEEHIVAIVTLLKEYKNNRYKFMQNALNISFSHD